MEECNNSKIFYRLIMWLIKELPKNIIKVIIHKATFIDLIKTPIDLIRWDARTLGQKEAKLSEEARQIEWLNNNN
jgi:hypothetical protein